MTNPSPCVALVPSGAVFDPGFEAALTALTERGFQIHRARDDEPPPGFRDRMVAKALAEGFEEFLWLNPAVVFDPNDVARLQALNVPFACGVYPWPGVRGVACTFPPGTSTVRFGIGGGPTPILASNLGFALIRRTVFEKIAAATPAGTEPAFFKTSDPEATPPAEDLAFCERVRSRGFELIADTSIRLWIIAPARLSWEDAASDRDRHPGFTIQIAGVPPTVAAPPPAKGGLLPEPIRSPLRPPAKPLPAGFPRLGIYIPTYPANAESLKATLESVRASDWGEEPNIIRQPSEWPVGRNSGSATYRRAMEAALADDCDFALFLEDDVRVNRHLRQNLLSTPLVTRDQCDYLGLFLPDTIADPWLRSEPHLGYRLAVPRYAGPNLLWTRTRVWGSQAYLISRRLLKVALEMWDGLTEGQDSRMMTVCSQFRAPLWYTMPCLVNHAPFKSAFDTPDAYAPDFDPNFRLVVGSGFHQPDGIIGTPSSAEAELLWRTATKLDVLELGTGAGRATVCLAQSARRVVSVDIADQSEAAEWLRRFRLDWRVELVQGDVAVACHTRSEKFGLALLDTDHDEASIVRDIDAALRVLAPRGLLAFTSYPDPAWPEVRRVVDGYAKRLGWQRVAQTGFLGVFRTA